MDYIISALIFLALAIVPGIITGFSAMLFDRVLIASHEFYSLRESFIRCFSFSMKLSLYLIFFFTLIYSMVLLGWNPTSIQF